MLNVKLIVSISTIQMTKKRFM